MDLFLQGGESIKSCDVTIFDHFGLTGCSGTMYLSLIIWFCLVVDALSENLTLNETYLEKDVNATAPCCDFWLAGDLTIVFLFIVLVPCVFIFGSSKPDEEFSPSISEEYDRAPARRASV